MGEYHYGVQVKFAATGRFHQPSMTKFTINLGASISLFGLATIVVDWLVARGIWSGGVLGQEAARRCIDSFYSQPIKSPRRPTPTLSALGAVDAIVDTVPMSAVELTNTRSFALEQ